jgi:hypothetical protein
MDTIEQSLTSRLIGFLHAYGVKLPLAATFQDTIVELKKLIEGGKEISAETKPAALANSQNGMNEPDYSTISSLEAGKLFQSYVRDIEKSSACDYATANLRVKLERPALFARMSANEASALDNHRALGNDITPLPAKPIFSPQLCALLGLPASAYGDNELTDMVWRVTKGNTGDIDYQQLFKCVVALVGVRNKSHGDLARSAAAEQFPELARKAAAAEKAASLKS